MASRSAVRSSNDGSDIFFFFFFLKSTNLYCAGEARGALNKYKQESVDETCNVCTVLENYADTSGIVMYLVC